MAADACQTITSINAVLRFIQWTEWRAAEARSSTTLGSAARQLWYSAGQRPGHRPGGAGARVRGQSFLGKPQRLLVMILQVSIVGAAAFVDSF